MANDETFGGSGKTAIRDQGHIAGQTLADQGSGDAQHFTHAGTALGTLIADDENVAGLDRIGLDRGEGILLAFKHPGRTGEFSAVMPGQFEHGAFGRQITRQDPEAAVGLDRLGD